MSSWSIWKIVGSCAWRILVFNLKHACWLVIYVGDITHRRFRIGNTEPSDVLRNCQRFRTKYTKPSDSLRNYEKFGMKCTKTFDVLLLRNYQKFCRKYTKPTNISRNFRRVSSKNCETFCNLLNLKKFWMKTTKPFYLTESKIVQYNLALKKN